MTEQRIADSSPKNSLGAPPGDPLARMARNHMIASELLAIARGFDAAGIPFIVLKGVPLAYRIYGRLQDRRIRDNDLLLRHGDVDRAVEKLRSFAYTPFYPKVRPSREVGRTNEHEMTRIRPPGVTMRAEIHWNAFYPGFYDVPEAIEWAHTQPFVLNGITLNVFDEPLTLIHLAVQFAQHAVSEAWILRDVAAAWNTWHRDIDRDRLLGLARATGTVHALDFSLRAAGDLDLLVAPPALGGSRRAALLRRLIPSARLFEPRPFPDHWRTMLAFLLSKLRRAPRYLCTANLAGRPGSATTQPGISE